MLRARLTLLYSTLMGGVILLFGMAVYALVSVTLVNQIDDLLNNTAEDILEIARVDAVGELTILRLPPLDISTNVYVQVWDRHGRLISTSLESAQFPEALDNQGLVSPEAALNINTSASVIVLANIASIPIDRSSR